MKKFFRKTFRLRSDLGIHFYVIDFIFRKILRQNSEVKWAVHHTSTIRNAHKLSVGKNTWPGDSPGVYINARNGIYVGDHTNIGPNVTIVSANHDFINNDQFIPSDPISIGKHSWIGSGASILPGVALGDFTIVGAGAVVTKSFAEGYCVIAGNPAKILRHLDKETCQHFESTKER